MTALALMLFSGLAHANIDPECESVAAAGPPADYNEQAQADYLLNFGAIAFTFSPTHAPVPHEPGHGTAGLEVMMKPNLSCERRLVLGYTKTEDTNKGLL